jgi:hypothetical protein
MQSSGMWKCAVGQKVSHVLMDWSLVLVSPAHGHYSPSKHCRLLTQCHSVTPEKTWIFRNTAVRNSNVVCHTSLMSVNRSKRWTAAIIYHFNCKISKSSDEWDSSKSGDYQFEKKDILICQQFHLCALCYDQHLLQTSKLFIWNFVVLFVFRFRVSW